MSKETKQLEAGQSLDRLVAEKMGWKDDGSGLGMFTPPGGTIASRTITEIPHYSEDIAAAFKLVEFMRSKGYRFHLYEHDRKSPGDDFTGWVAGFTSREPMKMNSQWRGETVPLAICRAFLVLELS